MDNAYLTGLPAKFLRTLTSFYAQGTYFLLWAAETSPSSFLLQIWPWLNAWKN